MDLWRINANGHPKLTLRRIGTLIQFFPPDSAINIALGGPGWTLENYLLAHIFQGFTGIPYPGLPSSSNGEDPIRLKKLEKFKERAQERRRQLASGEIPN